jgi:hypothetical protein
MPLQKKQFSIYSFFMAHHCKTSSDSPVSNFQNRRINFFSLSLQMNIAVFTILFYDSPQVKNTLRPDHVSVCLSVWLSRFSYDRGNLHYPRSLLEHTAATVVTKAIVGVQVMTQQWPRIPLLRLIIPLEREGCKSTVPLTRGC